jgi:hypothetical protein
MTIQEFRKFWEKKDYRVHSKGIHYFVRARLRHDSFKGYICSPSFVFSRNEILRSSEEDMDQTYYTHLFKNIFD